MSKNSERSSAALALIISEESPKKTLLTQRNQPDKPLRHRKWHLPGGAVEATETPAATLKRELQEELGWIEINILNQTIIEQPSNDFSSKNTLFYIFLIQASISKHIDISKDDDASDAHWFEIDEIINLPTFPLVSKALKAFELI